MNVGANTFGLRTVFYGDFDRGLQQLKEAGITVLSACSERVAKEIVEEDGSIRRESSFRFVRFRKY